MKTRNEVLPSNSKSSATAIYEGRQVLECSEVVKVGKNWLLIKRRH